MKRFFLLACSCLFLAACETGQNFAPVTDISTYESLPSSGAHRVVHGETLYEIAWRYGLDYRYLAKRNNMHSPYTLYTGQKIYLSGEAPATATALPSAPEPVVTKTTTITTVKSVKQVVSEAIKSEPSEEPHFTTAAWVRPTKGKIVNYFSPSNKGINIAGVAGTPIYASAAGKVVYAGAGLRGYGNLIIIKHNSLFLSAYAHNEVILINEGQWVRKGQKIAEMGDTGTNRVMLHFEIRKAGRPINPLTLIAV